MKREKKCESLIAHLKKGFTLAEASEAVGVSRVTIWRWRKSDPDLDDAVSLAMDRANEKVEAVVFRNCLDPNPANNMLRIFWLRNRWPEVYARSERGATSENQEGDGKDSEKVDADTFRKEVEQLERGGPGKGLPRNKK